MHRYLFEEDRADRAFLEAHTRNAVRLRERAGKWTFACAAAEAGVPAADIERLAQWYADASPALIRCGWGQERNRNGGSSSMAILALPAVAGKFGVRGGGYAMSNSSAWNIERTWIRDQEPPTRLVNMNQLGRALTEYSDPPIKALFVYNSNAAVTSPHQTKVLQGLEREDLFTVVFEQTLTDTARYADVLLPATTFLEGYDLVRGYGSISLRLGPPVVEPVGESRSNADVFSELLTRLELAADEPNGELEEMLDVLTHLPEPAGTQVRESGAAAFPFDGRPIQFVDVFPRTPDQKVDLCCEALDQSAPAGLYGYQPDPATAEFPLTLISPASERSITSTLAELPRPEVRLQMHPDDAAARNLVDGDAVRIFNALGEVHCPVAVTPNVRQGTVSLSKGLWRKSTFNGSTSNALSPDTLTDLGGGACFNDARVQVTSLGRH